MPSKGLGSLLGKLVNRLRKQPKPPPVSKKPIKIEDVSPFGGKFVGHRGYALGSTEEGKMDLSPENKAKWKQVSRESAEGFLNGEPLFVHSTNVVAAQYYADENKMQVEFKGGSAYLYSNVSLEEAWDFLEAGSKGSWIWDKLRVRGSKTAHRKPYTKIKTGFKDPAKLAEQKARERAKSDAKAKKEFDRLSRQVDDAAFKRAQAEAMRAERADAKENAANARAQAEFNRRLLNG